MYCFAFYLEFLLEIKIKMLWFVFYIRSRKHQFSMFRNTVVFIYGSSGKRVIEIMVLKPYSPPHTHTPQGHLQVTPIKIRILYFQILYFINVKMLLIERWTFTWKKEREGKRKEGRQLQMFETLLIRRRIVISKILTGGGGRSVYLRTAEE